MDEKLAQFDRMQAEMDQLKQSLAMAQHMHSQVQGMIDDGQIKHDDNNNLVAVNDPSESEHLRS